MVGNYRINNLKSLLYETYDVVQGMVFIKVKQMWKNNNDDYYEEVLVVKFLWENGVWAESWKVGEN